MERKLWIEAVEAFRVDVDALVPCPSCHIGYLEMTDVPFDDNNSSKGGERYLRCRNCGKTEIVLYRNPPENWLSKSNRAHGSSDLT
jgi:hypothetical protein